MSTQWSSDGSTTAPVGIWKCVGMDMFHCQSDEGMQLLLIFGQGRGAKCPAKHWVSKYKGLNAEVPLMGNTA